MKLLGLTGGPGMGKSEAAAALQRRGVPVVDTDELARDIVEPGQPALEEIEEVFGPGLVDAGGRLQREKLAEVVFADAAARSKLEAILHPRISKLWHTKIQDWQMEKHLVGVVVIPLLFETGAQAEFDSIICVACSRTTQQARLMSRGWTARQIAQRRSAQLSIEQKVARSNYVVWNEGDLSVLSDQLSRILPAT